MRGASSDAGLVNSLAYVRTVDCPGVTRYVRAYDRYGTCLCLCVGVCMRVGDIFCEGPRAR